MCLSAKSFHHKSSKNVNYSVNNMSSALALLADFSTRYRWPPLTVCAGFFPDEKFPAAGGVVSCGEMDLDHLVMSGFTAGFLRKLLYVFLSHFVFSSSRPASGCFTLESQRLTEKSEKNHGPTHRGSPSILGSHCQLTASLIT